MPINQFYDTWKTRILELRLSHTSICNNRPMLVFRKFSLYNIKGYSHLQPMTTVHSFVYPF